MITCCIINGLPKALLLAVTTSVISGFKFFIRQHRWGIYVSDMTLQHSRKEACSEENKNPLKVGWSPLVGILVPMETDTSREPNDPKAKVNFNGPQKPKQGTLTSDRVGKN